MGPTLEYIVISEQVKDESPYSPIPVEAIMFSSPLLPSPCLWNFIIHTFLNIFIALTKKLTRTMNNIKNHKQKPQAKTGNNMSIK